MFFILYIVFLLMTVTTGTVCFLFIKEITEACFNNTHRPEVRYWGGHE